MLKVNNVSFGYESKLVVKNLSFEIPKGTHLSLIGASGCGKSTLLKLICGKYDVTSGDIFWNNDRIYGPSRHLVFDKDFVKYLTQDSELMPFISVGENVGRFLSNLYPQKKQERIFELLQMIQMQEFKDIKARYLSGGQQQRVALAMTLAKEPELLLLDEPFSQIDSFQKNHLRRNLFEYLKKKKITCIVATHDAIDSLSFSDKVLVMKDGEKLVFGNPIEIYHNPSNLYTASLFGEVTPIIENNKTKFYYPHQIFIDKNSPNKATVKKSYFQGDNFLIVLVNNQGAEIFVKHPISLPTKMEVGYMKKK